MKKKVLRVSKFLTVCYGDALAEQECYAANFIVNHSTEKAYFSFKWQRGLDFQKLESNMEDLDTFILEDIFLCRKLKTFLKNHQELQYFYLDIEALASRRVSLRRIQFQKDRVFLYCI